MAFPPFNSTRSNTSAIWEFWPDWLGRTAITCPTTFDPLGISVPSGVLIPLLVCTTTASPLLAVFESSLFTSSPFTGLICTVAAATVAAALELVGGVASAQQPMKVGVVDIARENGVL